MKKLILISMCSCMIASASFAMDGWESAAKLQARQLNQRLTEISHSIHDDMPLEELRAIRFQLLAINPDQRVTEGVMVLRRKNALLKNIKGLITPLEPAAAAAPAPAPAPGAAASSPAVPSVHRGHITFPAFSASPTFSQSIPLHHPGSESPYRQSEAGRKRFPENHDR